MDNNYNYNRNDYNIIKNQINKTEINNNNYNNKALTSRNKILNNKDGYFFSYFPKNCDNNNNEYSNDIINNSQINYKKILSYRNKKIKNIFLQKSYKNLLMSKMNDISNFSRNKNKNKNNDKIYKIEQKQCNNNNYLTLVNDIEKLKSTVVKYKKSNLELKQEIEKLNKKILFLSNKNNNSCTKVKNKCYVKKRINSYKGRNNSKENEQFIKKKINTIEIIYKSVSQKELKSNHKNKSNLFLDKEESNDKNKNNMKIYYNCFNDVNYKENPNNILKNINIKDKYKSRNLSNDYIFKNNKNSNKRDGNISSILFNHNNSEIFNNDYGKIVNISQIYYNKTSTSLDDININNNIFNNNSSKDDIIEKKILLKKENKDQLKYNFKKINLSSSPDIKKLYIINKNNIFYSSKTIRTTKSNLQKNEILINMSRLSSNKKNHKKQKLIFKKPILNLDNYIYHKKTKTHSYNRNKKGRNNFDYDYDDEINDKIEKKKQPINIINITTIKNNNNKVVESKTNRIYPIQNIEKNYYKNNNNKNMILQKLLQNKPKINRNSVNELVNNNLFLYGIDNKNNLIQFNISTKLYTRLRIYEIKDLSKSFYANYIYNSSIILNTLKGIFILTGINSNILYFYNSKTKTITKICTYLYSHYKGSLLLDEENDRIFVFSGKNITKCEYFSFTQNKVIEIPELNIDRVNASFFIKNHIIYCFFGYSHNNNQYVKNIEFINCKLMKQWENKYLNYNFEFNIERCANISYNEDINKVYLYIEGKKNKENKIKRMMYLCHIDKEEINIINNLIIDKFKEDKYVWVKINSEENENEFHFDKCFSFMELPSQKNNNYFDNNNDNISVFLDNKSNAYFFNKNQMKMEIYSK